MAGFIPATQVFLASLSRKSFSQVFLASFSRKSFSQVFLARLLAERCFKTQRPE
jgi:hypothetical protein